MIDSPFLGFLYAKKLLHGERGQTARRGDAGNDHRSTRRAQWTHLSGLSAGRTRLSPCADASVDAAPARRHAFPVVVLNESKRRVPELDQRSAVHLTEAVLHIADRRTGHEQRTGDFEQRRTLDGLHLSPEMAVPVAQGAVPPSAG